MLSWPGKKEEEQTFEGRDCSHRKCSRELSGSEMSPEEMSG